MVEKHLSFICYEGVVIQYLDIDFATLNLHLVHQEVHRDVPLTLRYHHARAVVVSMVVSRLYHTSDDSSIDVHLMSLHIDVTSVDGMTEISRNNRCPHINDLSLRGKHLRASFVVLVVNVVLYVEICLQSNIMKCATIGPN
jgi:hypothetical protein